jgi:hypothetical protein
MQIELRPPQQAFVVDRVIWRQTLFFQFRQHKAIDRRARPVRILHRGQIRLRERPKRPMLAPLLDVDRARLRRDLALARIRSAHVDPFDEVGDDLLRQLGRLRRHLRRSVVLERLDEQALLRLTCHQHGPGVAALEHAFLAVEIEARLEFLGLRGMAFVAILTEYRADFAFEKLDAFR